MPSKHAPRPARTAHPASLAPASPSSASPSPANRVFDVDCKLSYTLLDSTHFLFLVHALDGMDQQVLDESLRITPALPHTLHADPVTGSRTLRLTAAAGPLTLRYRARVQLLRPPVDLQAAEVPVEDLPHDVLADLMPSRYCESDKLASVAGRLFGDTPPGLARVQAVNDWIHDQIEYRIGSTDASTTAADVFLQRTGVCRDFAHLGVALCRALNIPARMAVGYTRFDEPPPDFHAVFEAFVGGRWVLFDPTGLAEPQDLVRIAVGRDAGDVAFATLFGSVRTRLIRPEVEQVRARRARTGKAAKLKRG